MNQIAGKYLILAGMVIIICGIIVYFFPGFLKWPGRLPGDVRVERKNFHFYFPFVTMLIISLLITIILNFIKKLF